MRSLLASFALPLVLTCASASATQPSSCVILVIESQAQNIGHVMDDNWVTTAMSYGHLATIAPASTLGTQAWRSTTDILIVASGIESLAPAWRANIEGFLVQGGQVYLQCEYLVGFDTNKLFRRIVANTGGTFAWSSTVAGSLEPVTVSGPLASTPNVVPALDYYWYGATGSGTNTTPFLDTAGTPLGWIYDVPGGGTLITTTDQDWVRQFGPDDMALTGNILQYLCQGVAPVGTNYCTTNPNSTGVAASMQAFGSRTVSVNGLTLVARDIPSQQFGYFLMSQATGFTGNFGGSQGNLCLGQPIVRFSQNILNPGQANSVQFGVDLMNLPQSTVVQPGDTWNFQYWTRDLNPGQTSNTTDGLSITFL